MENNVSSALYNLLVTRDFDPEILDASGKAISNPADAELFSFDWKTPEKNYGTVVALLDNDQNLQLYYGDNLGRAMEGEDKQAWYKFLEQMKNFAVRNMLNFELNNINRLKYTMQGMAAIKEGLFEGYYGTRKMSYSDQPKKVKLVIKHNKTLGEGDARHRYIESIFVETADGERFKVPSRSLTHGKMLARHVAEGGNPYDAFGQHITEMVAEMATLSRFIRAAKNRELNESAAALAESAQEHYNTLRRECKSMIGSRGYRAARDAYRPDEIRDTETAVDVIRDLFLEQTLDQRIEEALPVLSKLATRVAKKNVFGRKVFGHTVFGEEDDMKEVDAFECWTSRLEEGTWALPETAEQQAKLAELLAAPLEVGPDATNATEQLYDIFGDDELFDRLGDLSTKDPEADARPIIIDRLEELGITIKMPAEAEAQPEVQEDLDTDGVMMTKPSNMSSESVERFDLGRLIELAKK